jgi:hypothetical protein
MQRSSNVRRVGVEPMHAAYIARDVLRPLAANRRVSLCGMIAVHSAPQVVVNCFEARTDVFCRGVLACGRQWGCPVCAARRARKRADEIKRLLFGCGDRTVQMLTLTVTHRRGQALRDLCSVLLRALNRLRTRRRVRELFARHVEATVRALEVTHGRNGWHPHLHVLLVTDAWTDAERRVLEEEWLLVAPEGTTVSRGVAW